MKMKPATGQQLVQIFNKFAGREVPMNEQTKTMHLKNLGDYTYNEVTLKDPNDKVLKEMNDEAAKHGFSLRVMWEGMGGTADYREDRINATIEKSADGKWRVSPNFGIG